MWLTKAGIFLNDAVDNFLKSCYKLEDLIKGAW